MWFAVFMFFQPVPIEARQLPATLLQAHYPSELACVQAAAETARAMPYHGRFLCMYHGEPARRLRVAAKFQF